MSALLINSGEVDTAFRDCLYRREELKHSGEIPEDVVLVEGVTGKFAFHPGRLEENREKVRKWLESLPMEFRKNYGGGASFLDASRQINDLQWTPLLQHIEQLLCLGMGLGMVKCSFIREVWEMLPGGAPIYVIDFDQS